MSEFSKSSLNKAVRGSKRATYDKDTVYQLLDSHFICHVSFVHEGTAMSLPTGYGRKNDTIYLHGAISNRTLNSLLETQKASLTVTHLDGLVLARSVFSHSFNYRSVVVFGKVRLLSDEHEKMEALEIITENIIANRWKEARIPNEKELKATLVVALEIEDASAKIRTGGPNDDEEDYELDVWAGELPLQMISKEPIADDRLHKKQAMSPSVSNFKL